MKKRTNLFLVAAVGLSLLITVSAAADPVTVTKTSGQASYGTNTIAFFTVTISNPGAAAVTIDGIYDQLPTGFVYVSLDPLSQVTAINSTMVPWPGATGSIIFFGGILSGGNMSYYIPAGGSIILRYSAITPGSPASNLVTTVSAFIGNSVVGSTTNTVSVESILPRTLIAFNGGWSNANHIKLDWTIISESPGDSYMIEKMNSNGLFNAIGLVNSKGTPGTEQSYSFIDSFPAKEKNSYRLRLIGPNSQTKYSPIILINRDQAAWSMDKVFPSPFTTELNIQIATPKKQTVTLQLSDRSGNIRVSCGRSLGSGTNTIILGNLELLPPGMYVLKVSSEGRSMQQQLVKMQ